MKVADTVEAAFDLQEKYEGQPHGWVQWKGTNVCMDVHCECGELCHIDGDFVYAVQCPNCQRSYAVSGFVELIELRQAPENVKLLDID